MKPRAQQRRAPRSGFSLVELLISFTILVGILVAVLALFDRNNRLARTQLYIADMQQSSRVGQAEVVRYIRMAARGGISLRQWNDGLYPGKLVPNGVAIEVENNVPAGTTIVPGGPNVVAGTDILTVRGVFNTTLYQTNPATGMTLVRDGDGVVQSGTILVQDPSPTTGVPQDLTALRQVIDEGVAESLLITSPLADSVYAAVQLNPGASLDNGDSITLAFTTTDCQLNGGGEPEGLLCLSQGGEFPDALNAATSVGILEEYRYYIRRVPAGTRDLTARLSRARLVPGTATVYRDAVNLREDIADNIVDLQVALAVDSDLDNVILENDPADAADDWLFNSSDDSPPNQAKWNGAGPLDTPRPMFYVRLSTLARTDRADPAFIAPAIQTVEDHVYNEPVNPSTEAERRQRIYRRRLVQTVVDLRNVS